MKVSPAVIFFACNLGMDKECVHHLTSVLLCTECCSRPKNDS